MDQREAGLPDITAPMQTPIQTPMGLPLGLRWDCDGTAMGLRYSPDGPAGELGGTPNPVDRPLLHESRMQAVLDGERGND